MKRWLCGALTLLAAALGLALGASSAPSRGAAADAQYPVAERSIAQLTADLAAGNVTSEALTRAYLARIDALDVHGPALHSVIALNPLALDQARQADRERAARRPQGPLAGIPVLVKDNIETADGTPTTAGSAALAGNIARRDAPVVTRLREAGAIVIGKTNLSEWANFRSSNSMSGWSALGGLVRNPYALDRSACGSSSGTGAAIAASLAAVGVGTETDGSVTCPAAINGLVGLKPTVGLVSRTYIVPISHSQDTPGPLGRSVADVAVLLAALAGSDARDPATREADAHRADYVRAVEHASLHAKRLGVLRYALSGLNPAVRAAFDRAVADLRTHGAQIVELPAYKPDPALGDAEFTVLLTEFHADLDAYLATTPPTVRTRSLADVIAFNHTDARELALFGQDIFSQAVATKGLTDKHYVAARRLCLKVTRSAGIDALVGRYRLDALIAPTYGAASRIDVVDGDNLAGNVASLPAVAGYPHLTVPMGYVRGLPVGISFIGPAWSEASLLALGAAYERIAPRRRAPQYLASIEAAGPIRRLFAPPTKH